MFSLPVGEHVEGFEVKLGKRKVWERFATLGQVAVLEGERLEVCFSCGKYGRDEANVVIVWQETKKTFEDAINGEDVEMDADGKVLVHGKTYAVWTSKIPTEGRSGLTNVEHPKE